MFLHHERQSPQFGAKLEEISEYCSPLVKAVENLISLNSGEPFFLSISGALPTQMAHGGDAGATAIAASRRFSRSQRNQLSLSTQGRLGQTLVSASSQLGVNLYIMRVECILVQRFPF